MPLRWSRRDAGSRPLRSRAENIRYGSPIDLLIQPQGTLSSRTGTSKPSSIFVLLPAMGTTRKNSPPTEGGCWKRIIDDSCSAKFDPGRPAYGERSNLSRIRLFMFRLRSASSLRNARWVLLTPGSAAFGRRKRLPLTATVSGGSTVRMS